MNTIPGMTPTSLLPMAAKKSGINFDDLVIEILQLAQLDSEG
jgi:D-alanine-D-alanine ligase